MQTKTPYRKQNRRPNKSREYKKVERPAFVPRAIETSFREIEGVTEVRPRINTPAEIEITLLVNQSYNHELQDKILMVEAAIQHSLRSRHQKFYATISWQ